MEQQLADEILRTLVRIERKIDKMSEQQNELDADVQEIQAAFGTLAGTVTSLTSYIALLVAGEQELDLDQLDALAQAAAGNVQAVTNLLPAASTSAAPVETAGSTASAS